MMFYWSQEWKNSHRNLQNEGESLQLPENEEKIAVNTGEERTKIDREERIILINTKETRRKDGNEHRREKR